MKIKEEPEIVIFGVASRDNRDGKTQTIRAWANELGVTFKEIRRTFRRAGLTT